MEFSKLAELLQTIISHGEQFGRGIKCQAALDHFDRFLREKYAKKQGELTRLMSSDEEVPQEMLENFRPLYSAFKMTYEPSTGEKLDPI